MIIAIYLFVSISTINAQVALQWVARYNEPSGIDGDGANSIVVNSSGDVFVTGYSFGSGRNQDFVTIKYNFLGVQQWLARYNGPVNGPDAGNSIAIDDSDNVYVTGWSSEVGGNSDYVTIKYNSSGIQQWLQIYNGPGNELDAAHSIAIDNTGNVCVTGVSVGSGTNYDYATIKYNSSGVRQWIVRYNGPGNVSDEAYSLAVDDSGNVYITGTSTGSGTGNDYATIKYNSSGVQQWVQRYNGQVNGFDGAYSIAVDDSGNVYVTGESYGSLTGSDCVTIKYNSSGVQQWVQRYNGPVNGGDRPNSITVDGSRNVYVTGYSYGSGTIVDYGTIKYNSSGVEQWVQRYNGPVNGIDRANSITVDGSGNVYVTGESYGILAGSDYATIKYVQTPSYSPNLFSPLNNSQGWGLTLLLVWCRGYRVPNTANFHVQVSTDSLFANIILNDSTVTDSTKGVGGLQNNTWYY